MPSRHSLCFGHCQCQPEWKLHNKPPLLFLLLVLVVMPVSGCQQYQAACMLQSLRRSVVYSGYTKLLSSWLCQCGTQLRLPVAPLPVAVCTAMAAEHRPCPGHAVPVKDQPQILVLQKVFSRGSGELQVSFCVRHNSIQVTAVVHTQSLFFK
jgi:hypothetical protein